MKRLSALLILIFISACSSYQIRYISDYEKAGINYIRKARKELSRGNLKDSQKNVDIAHDIATKYNLPYLKVYVMLEKANILLFFGDLSKAEYYLTETEEIIKKEAPDLYPYLITNKASLMYIKGDKEVAKTLISEIKVPPDEILAQYLILNSISALEEKNHELFEKSLTKALKKVKKEENYILESYIHKLFAEYYRSRSDFTNSVNSLKNALNTERFLNNREGIIYCLEKLAELYESQGKKDETFYYYYQLWEITSSAGDYKRSQRYMDKALGGM